jgi:sarcosine oxidase subunit beta
MSTTADVVIIGGGVMGASSAFQLARRGLKVVLVEKNFLAGGTTGKSSAIVRQHYSNETTAFDIPVTPKTSLCAAGTSTA